MPPHMGHNISIHFALALESVCFIHTEPAAVAFNHIHSREPVLPVPFAGALTCPQMLCSWLFTFFRTPGPLRIYRSSSQCATPPCRSWRPLCSLNLRIF